MKKMKSIFVTSLIVAGTISAAYAATARCYFDKGKEFCIVCNEAGTKCKVVIFDNDGADPSA